MAPKKSQLPLAVAIVGGCMLIAVALMLRGQRRAAEAAVEAAQVAAPATAAPAAGADTGLVTATTSVSVTAAPAPAVPETPKEKADRAKKTADKASGNAALGKDAHAVAKPETVAAKPQITAVANVDMEVPEPAAAPPAAGSPLTGGAALLGQRTGPTGPSPEVYRELERAVTSYARALADGDAGAAAAAWPDMPEFRRQQLMQEFGNGLRYSTRWKVTEVKLDGGKATAKLTGTTTDVRNGQLAGSRAVDEQIGFTKKGKSWKLKQIAQ
jgi:hypothetical protein